MRHLLAAVLALPAFALAQDPLKSPACAEALAVLESARGTDQSTARRSEAARICLGGGAPGTRSNRWAQPPIAVPAPQIDVPMRPVPLPQVTLPPPPVTIARPPAVTACDPNGCWTSEGARLPRTGPQLMGPNGLCTAQGGFAYCP